MGEDLCRPPHISSLCTLKGLAPSQTPEGPTSAMEILCLHQPGWAKADGQKAETGRVGREWKEKG